MPLSEWRLKHDAAWRWQVMSYVRSDTGREQDVGDVQIDK